ncbi:MAG TPA: FAD-dependent oxidoreductase [Phnomibacter sp.]|nr:FAD-dependent oxidoreductase [Phnomibacter sp.]
MSFTRRKFIQNAALVAAGSLLIPRHLVATPYVAKPKHVLILGAGFAGLAAAYALHKQKIPFTILEARNRIGGRVHSFAPKEADGLVVELGAEWIGLSHERVLALCEEFKLPLLNNQFKTHVLYQGKYTGRDSYKFSEEWQPKWNQIMKAYAADDKKLSSAQMEKKYGQMDWWRFLVNNGCADRDLDFRELGDSTDFGESIRQVSALAALGEYYENEKYNAEAAGNGRMQTSNQMDYKIVGGNGKLAGVLADTIGRSNIRIGSKVITVEQGEKVKISSESGETFTGDKLICTVPTFALRQINWKPGLPASLRNAIDELQYGRINKHPVLFSKRFWKDEDFDMLTDMPAHYFYHATKSQSGDKGILISYTIGDKAAVVGNNAANDAWNLSMINDALQPAFGDISKLAEKQWNYYWGNDQFSKGAYAIYGPGQWKRVLNAFQLPHLHTHFAGEHLADWQGFMEGAIETGEAAVEAILQKVIKK